MYLWHIKNVYKDVINLFIYFSLRAQSSIYMFSGSVLRNFKGTECEVTKAVTSCLKCAPDRIGGGGRKVLNPIMSQ